jgi:biopolymer transport protein ExbB
MFRLLEYLKYGGDIVWIIIGCGVLAFCVFVERALHLHRSRIKTDDFLKGIFNIMRKNNPKEALTICEETPGPVAYVVKTAILHRHDSKDEIREAVNDASLAEVSRMERRLVVIASVAQIAPLLGLLGTVLGMIESVAVLSAQEPLIRTADVMGGLMKALVSTAAGLAVAIPCYAAFNLLVVKIDRILLDVEKSGSEMLAFITSPGVVSNGHAGNDKNGHA